MAAQWNQYFPKLDRLARAARREMNRRSAEPAFEDEKQQKAALQESIEYGTQRAAEYEECLSCIDRELLEAHPDMASIPAEIRQQCVGYEDFADEITAWISRQRQELLYLDILDEDRQKKAVAASQVLTAPRTPSLGSLGHSGWRSVTSQVGSLHHSGRQSPAGGRQPISCPAATVGIPMPQVPTAAPVCTAIPVAQQLLTTAAASVSFGTVPHSSPGIGIWGGSTAPPQTFPVSSHVAASGIMNTGLGPSGMTIPPWYQHQMPLPGMAVSGPAVVQPLPPTGVSFSQGAGQFSGQIHVKLPKLELMRFRGETARWRPFWCRFHNSVGKNGKLSGAEKLTYLTQALEGNPLSLVQGLDLVDENYDVAVRVLAETYGNPAVAIEEVEANLYRLDCPRNDAVHLRKFYCEMESNLGSLQGLGRDVTSDHLVSVILSKLPFPVVSNLEHAKRPTVAWSVNLLRGLLKEEVEMREASERRCGKKPLDYNKRVFYKAPSTTEALAGPEYRKKSSSKKWMEYPCFFCKTKGHWHENCREVPKTEDREKILVSQGRCLICLKRGHDKNSCYSNKSCAHCDRGKLHHRSLCPKKFPSGKRAKETSASGSDTTQQVVSPVYHNGQSEQAALTLSTPEASHLADDERTILKTALADVCSTDKGEATKIRMFLDSGCSRTYITEKLAKHLNLRTESTQSLTVNRFGGGSGGKHTIMVKTATVFLRTVYGRSFRLKVAVTADIMNRMTKVAVDESVLGLIPKDIQLADTPFKHNKDVEIDFLLGNDYYDDFVTGTRIEISAGLRLVSSEFGWIMTGRVPDDNKSPHEVVALYSQELANLLITDDEMVVETEKDDYKSAPMEDLWSLETIGITENPNPVSDDKAVDQFNQTVRFENGRYHVAWPWKANAEDLPNNYEIAKRRLVSTINRLKRTDGLIERYDGVIKDQLKKTVIEEVQEATAHRVHYLPHREILTPDKETTKLRIVYDASARASPDKPSLNDCLHRGLVFMTAILCLLMRFMLAPIMVISDIEKAFLQVGLQEDQRDVTRFLWIRDITKPITAMNLVIYRFTRVAFGMSPSPFLLGATIVHHLRQSPLQIARLIEENTYVDNVITGFQTVADAIRFYFQSKSLFQQASMNLREFASNSSAVMQSIPQLDRATKTQIKVLGIGWNTQKDELSLNVPQTFPVAATKRQVMQGLLKLYDPLGFVCPVVIRSRLLLQRLCTGRSKGWNDRLPQTDIDAYQEIVSEYEKFRELRWPRFFGHSIDDDCRLMCFCDASKNAYATVIYLQHKNGAKFTSRILFAKARVSPIGNSMTIPRLELLAVLIGVRGIKFIREQLSFTGRVIAWTDSQCVLKWLGSNRVKGTFVENRLREIRNVADVEFKFVPTKENPADLPSRGVSATDLNNFWWQGPTWSMGEESEWPNVEVELKQSQVEFTDAELEVPDTQEFCLAAINASPPFGIEAEKYSTLGKLMRITAFCLRFTNRARKGFVPGCEYILPAELRQAERFWILYTQAAYFADVKRALLQNRQHPLKNQLGLVIDSEGIIRCRGRMGALEMPARRRAPILLPSDGWLTNLVVQYYHTLCLHGGRKITVNTMRRKYWIVRGAATTWKILKGCTTCRKVDGQGFVRPQMPDLPSYRVNRQFPFDYLGMDYFGPMKVRVDGKNEPSKTWGCIFTCLTTRAVHLELVQSLSAEDFLLALRRFIARRGKPAMILCDNGTHFAAVHKNDAISQTTEGREIQWSFITALSPWMGGAYERLIASVKSALKKSIGKALLSSDQLATMLAEVEYTLNSRPLTSSSEKEVDVALTPNDLIGVRNVGDEQTEFPDTGNPGNVSKEQSSMIEMFRRTRGIVNEFWRIWKDEYLNELRQTHRMKHHDNRGSVNRLPAVGEVVHLKEERAPRNKWKMGVIQELRYSHDNAIRSVVVKTTTGSTLKRPVSLVYPLEVRSYGQDKPHGEAEPKSVKTLSTPQESRRDGSSTTGQIQGSPSEADQQVTVQSGAKAKEADLHDQRQCQIATRTTRQAAKQAKDRIKQLAAEESDEDEE